MNKQLIYPIQRCEPLIAIVRDANAVSFKLEKNETVSGKKIKGIVFHPSSYLTKGPNGETLVASAGSLNNGYLTLKTTNGTETVNKIPLYLLAAGVTPGGTNERIFPLDGLLFDVENSYVTINTAGVFAANQIFLFNVFFDDDCVK